jgi:hypothetical protein
MRLLQFERLHVEKLRKIVAQSELVQYRIMAEAISVVIMLTWTLLSVGGVSEADFVLRDVNHM